MRGNRSELAAARKSPRCHVLLKKLPPQSCLTMLLPRPQNVLLKKLPPQSCSPQWHGREHDIHINNSVAKPTACTPQPKEVNVDSPLYNCFHDWKLNNCRSFIVFNTLTGTRAEKSSNRHKTWFRLLSPV